MKRLIFLILFSFLMLTGCTFAGERIKEPVTFYYVRDNYQKDMSQVISSEIRESAGHRDDISYLLALYSMGPSSDELQSTLPRNTKITLKEYRDEEIILELSESAADMTDSDFTLASACISLTCMDLSDIRQVTLVCGDRNITIQKDQLIQNNTIIP